MPQLASSLQQLQEAAGLPSLLEAARCGFQDMLTEIRAAEDPASPMFAALTLAAVSAADGRDAVCFAPSLPWPARQPESARPAVGAADTATGAVTSEITSLCLVLVARLELVARSAADPGDQAACRDAARCARDIHDLLAGHSR